MKLLKYTIAILIGVLAVSCQKVIDVNLNEANPKIVIVANYDGVKEKVEVEVTLTTNYFGTETTPQVVDANVTITDASGNVTNVPHTANGIYILENYTPNFNTEYTLNVVHNNVNYESKSTLKGVVEIENLFSEFAESGPFGQAGNIVYQLINDPEEDNFYRTLVWKNDSLFGAGSDLFVYNEDFLVTDPSTDLQVFTLFRYRFDVEDTVVLELRNINKKTSDYYEELSSVLDANSAAPTNPTYDWTNEGLGYFAAYSSSRDTIIIQ